MISVEILNETLCGNFDAIIMVLESLELTGIRPNHSKREIRCSREEGRNPSSIRINVDTLYYRCFSTGDKGSIYTLVMDKLGKNFPQSLKWVAGVLKLDHSELRQRKITLPFNGFFKKLVKQSRTPEFYLEKYDESTLDRFANGYSLLFNKDGIGYDTQRFFYVGYDFYSNRVTIPQWDVNGNLVGIMGRLNDPLAPKEARWLPIIPCQRSLTLFGYHFNYADIQRKRICFIGESEKFVMQLRSMGLRNALAVCGCDISSMQARYIKSLMCERLIVCFDEGLDEEQLAGEAKKLKITTPLYRNRVGYIYDAEHDVLTSGSKDSPSDLGIEAMKKLVKENVVWL